jgi:hypothetical protein
VDRGQHGGFASAGHAEYDDRRTWRWQLVLQDLQGGKEVLKADAAKLVWQPWPREVCD